MPNYLAIDTATESCSAALWFNGKLYAKQTIQPQKHAEVILEFVDELLQKAKAKKKDLDGLILGKGPGAFTGVRIATGVAQGIALALDIPVVAVSNLETLAFRAYSERNTQNSKTILVATDARMKEVYWCKYSVDSNSISALSKEIVSAPSQVDLKNVDGYIGSGFHVYPELKEYAEKTPMPYDSLVYSEAKDMLLLAKDNFENLAQPIENIEPVYLREP